MRRVANRKAAALATWRLNPFDLRLGAESVISGTDRRRHAFTEVHCLPGKQSAAVNDLC
jgi:hypothetical protein